MDFSAWSPSHTILVLFGIVVFISQVGVYFYRTKQNDKKLDKQGETFFHAIERLEERMDKGFVEVNQQIVGVRDELRGEIQGVREELRGEISGVRDELRSEIQGVRGEIADVRTEMNQQIGGVREELSKLNQNHIDHLTRHES